MRCKKEILFIALILLISLNLINLGSAVGTAQEYGCSLNVTLVEQDPYPAVPGEYVRLVFQLSGIDNSDCDGAKFGLMPEYPFSLDNNETIRVLDSYAYNPDQKITWTLPYKLRVAKDAITGENDLKVRYSEGNSYNWNAYSTETFNIAVEDSRTSFDVVVQESSGSEISLAIANIGKYVANSMVVRIPEQENYRVSGTNGQMVGNLESGDYTIVGFTVTQNMQRNPGTNAQTNQDLKVQVDYTDGIGERRSSTIEVPLQGSSFLTNLTTGNFSNGFQRRQISNSGLFSKWYFWVIILLVLALGFGFYHKYKTKVNNFFSKRLDNVRKKPSENLSVEPEWVKKDKAKTKH